MKEVSIFDIVETAGDRCMVVLLDSESDRFVPIAIGPAEGNALICGLRDIPVMRPLSHDLMALIVRELGGTLREVRIERLVDYTFYAILLHRTDGRSASNRLSSQRCHVPNIEGEWDEVFAAIRSCHEEIHRMGAPRISATLRFGTRTDREQTMADKVSSVETKLGSD